MKTPFIALNSRPPKPIAAFLPGFAKAPGPASSSSPLSARGVRLGWALLCGTTLAAGLNLEAGLMNLQYESSSSPNGPWQLVSSADLIQQADGSASFETEGTRFFRLRVEDGSPSNAPSVVRLGALPVSTGLRLTTRVSELARFLRPLVPSEDTNSSPQVPLGGLAGVAAWEGATFASNAIPIYDPALGNGASPAYVEIKVLGPVTRVRNAMDGAAKEQDFHRGAILLSLGTHDVGIPYFSTEGETPAERLVAQLGLTDAAGRRVLTPPPGHRVMRYGPTFHVLEDAAGKPVSVLGTQPFRPPVDLLSKVPDGARGGGDAADTEPANAPSRWSSLGFGHYENYDQFKQDYLKNPVYQLLRERRAARAKQEQDIEAGILPPAPNRITLPVGSNTLVLPGIVIANYFLDDDDNDLGTESFVRVSAQRGGGLRLEGVRSGAGELTVRAGRQVYRYAVTVPLRIIRPLSPVSLQAFTPGWQEPRVWDAGGYDEQPRYWQESRSRWCPKVGCGPVAWAILLGWWDRHGVPSAFTVGDSASSRRTSLRASDAPFYLDYDDSPSGYGRVISLYDVLHDSCDTICNPFGEAGATPPGDMVEAWWEPTKWGRRTDRSGTFWPYPAPVPADPAMGYWYSWSWDLMDPDWNEPSNVIRRANKKGRPAIVGLGWLWHYGVSYAYRYQEFKATENGDPILVRRWFKVNEGWNKGHGEWYSGGDTFLGFDLKLTQRHIPPPL